MNDRQTSRRQMHPLHPVVPAQRGATPGTAGWMEGVQALNSVPLSSLSSNAAQRVVMQRAVLLPGADAVKQVKFKKKKIV